MAVLVVGEVAVLVGTRGAVRDPFAPYEAIMPGHPSEILEHYPCLIYRDEASTVHCIFTLKEGPFDSVNIVYDHMIKWIEFSIRPGSLRLGDLVQCLGKPTSVMPSNPDSRMGFADVNWGQQQYAVIAVEGYNKQPGYLMPVYHFSIASEWQSCRSG